MGTISKLNLMELYEARDDLEARMDAIFEQYGKNEEFWHLQERLDVIYEEIYLREGWDDDCC